MFKFVKSCHSFVLPAVVISDRKSSCFSYIQFFGVLKKVEYGIHF